METILKNTLRVGNFTSSEIHRLMGTKKVAETYIKEKNFERKLGRSLGTESEARPLLWGKTIEHRAFEQLGIDYLLNSQETKQHPVVSFWSGSSDGIKHDEGKTVIDIKCPFTLKSFCELVECETIEQLRDNHKDGDKYFWQLVSNAIINECEYAELIVYVPYLSELEEIRTDAEDNGIKFIMYASQEELPYLLDGGHYKNINILRFKVSDQHKIELYNNVVTYGKLLNHEPQI